MLTSTAIALALLTAGSGNGGEIVRSFPQGAHLSLRAVADGCQNNPGPYITLDGALELSGVQARIILSNNRRFTHVTSADVTADVELIPGGEELVFHKQPSRGGVGGNPWIFFQVYESGRAVGKPKLLGRCVQGLNDYALDFDLVTTALASVGGGGCSNSGGPQITLDGELRLGGVKGEIILTNNRKFRHASSADVVLEIVLIPEGESLVFAKQPPLDGAGGNPHVFVQFLDGYGNEYGDAIYVGRCNQL